MTTGGFMGVEALLDSSGGTLTIDTNLVQATLPLDELGYQDRVFEAGGLGRRIRCFRLPDENPHRAVSFTRDVVLRGGEDNAFYIRATFEDGNILWSSPIYAIPT